MAPNPLPKRKIVTVVGSVNLDLVVRTSHLPKPGQTILGHDLHRVPGGKGGNQAVAAARLGAVVRMIGRLGDDPSSLLLRQQLEANGVDSEDIAETRDVTSGAAIIAVEDSGQNTIIVLPGANALLNAEDIRRAERGIATSDLLLVQLETPQDPVAAALTIARESRVFSVLNAAPIPDSLSFDLGLADLLCVNETEAAHLAGIPINNPEEACHAAKILRDKGVARVVITLGVQGAVGLDVDGSLHHAPAFPVKAIDATAAGDAFVAALGLAMVQGATLPEAMRRGNAAGGLAASKSGAQPSLPTSEELEILLSAGG
jgi:ribokinase